MTGEALRLEGVHKSFGRLEVLRGIDLAVAEHEVVCLIGASGSGKSTLLRCVNLLEPIQALTEGRARHFEISTRLLTSDGSAIDQDEAARVHARIAGVAQRFLGAGVESAGYVRSDPAASNAVRARVPLLLHAPASRAALDVRTLSDFVARALELRPGEEAAGMFRRFLRVLSRPNRW